MNPLFQIRDLACAYNQGRTVLHIKELDIPQGELVFLLGVSGSGKSTLIETLALMNNTLASGEVHFADSNNNTLKFSQLWQKNNPVEIAHVRKKHFSFIFQETNLMENFTAYENVCLSQMIKQNVRQDEAITGAKQLADQVGLSDQELNANTLAVNLSGGQRQRLAFVRAINNDFTVIFGDEPTGNLDEENANELLRILKQNIGQKSSAIVVSHDIDLAVQHADKIIVITKSSEGYGEILPRNIFNKKTWQTDSTEFRNRLSDLYKTPTQKIAESTTPTIADATTNPTYSSLFFKKEGKALAGKRRINFWILTTILALTFMAIGFANGSLNYLNKKMNNAFVKWVSISIPWRESGNAGRISERLNNPRLASEFDYENVSANVQYPLRFWNARDNKTIRTKGRSVQFTDKQNPLVSELLQDKNRLHGDTAMSGNQDLSLIVAKRLLDNLDMPQNAAFINMAFSVIDTAQNEDVMLRVPVPIRAVVKEIPGRNLMIYTLDFYKTVGQRIESTFDIRNARDIHLLVRGKRENAEDALAAINQFFKANPQYQSNEPEYEIKGEHSMSHAEGYDIAITFYPALRGAATNEIWTAIQKSPQFKNASKNIQRVYHYEPTQLRDKISYDHISLYFNDLSKVRTFADSLYYNPARMGAVKPIEVDIAQIKEKENFNFLSKITKIVAWLLVGFGATSISLFIFNLLKMHLSKVKMNIGTLKAFGLSNGEAQSIYFRIILRFLVVSLVLSLLIAAIFGYGADLLLADRVVGEEGVSYFNLLHPNTLITLAILAVVTTLVSRFTIRTILSKSPGDLIYGR